MHFLVTRTRATDIHGDNYLAKKKDDQSVISFLGGGGEIRTPAPDLSGLTI